MPLWEWLAGGAALAIIVWRIVYTLRRSYGHQTVDRDEALVRNLRAQRSDPFAPCEIDFFFTVPDAAGCQRLSAALKPEGFSVEFHAAGGDSVGGYSLHARKALSVSVDTIHEAAVRMRQLAEIYSASYDGWAAAGMMRQAR